LELQEHPRTGTGQVEHLKHFVVQIYTFLGMCQKKRTKNTFCPLLFIDNVLIVTKMNKESTSIWVRIVYVVAQENQRQAVHRQAEIVYLACFQDYSFLCGGLQNFLVWQGLAF
jgi:hypothetical protein